MYKSISVVDLLSLNIFQDKTRFDLICPDMDEEVGKVLQYLGVDTSKPIHIQACRHRTVDNKVVTDYRFCGHERTDKDWIKYADIDTRIMRHKDSSLQSELYVMSANTANEDHEDAEREFSLTAGDVDKEWMNNVYTIKALQSAQIAIRGCIHPEENLLFQGE